MEETITLIGFSDLHLSEQDTIREEVSKQAKKFSAINQVNELRVAVKPIHGTEQDAHKFEVKTTLDLNGKIYNAEVVDYNIFAAVDDVLEKIETQIQQ